MVGGGCPRRVGDSGVLAGVIIATGAVGPGVGAGKCGGASWGWRLGGRRVVGCLGRAVLALGCGSPGCGGRRRGVVDGRASGTETVAEAFGPDAVLGKASLLFGRHL